MGMRGKSYTMEALALLSALCIAGIFILAHYNRQSDTLDQMAYRLAEEVQPAATQFFTQDPTGELSVDALKNQGLSIPPQVQVEVPTYDAKQNNWQVKVWHPEGNKLYQVNAKGVEQTNQ